LLEQSVHLHDCRFKGFGLNVANPVVRTSSVFEENECPDFVVVLSVCHNAGYFWIQFAKENPLPELPAQLKIENRADLTEEAVTTTLRRALRFYSTIQADDGHWPGDFGGPMLLMPGLVMHISPCSAISPSLLFDHISFKVNQPNTGLYKLTTCKSTVIISMYKMTTGLY